MKERFLKFTGVQRTGVTFGTFHGVFYGILKQAYGLNGGNILSEEEKYAILRRTGGKTVLQNSPRKGILWKILPRRSVL